MIAAHLGKIERPDEYSQRQKANAPQKNKPCPGGKLQEEINQKAEQNETKYVGTGSQEKTASLFLLIRTICLLQAGYNWLQILQHNPHLLRRYQSIPKTK